MYALACLIAVIGGSIILWIVCAVLYVELSHAIYFWRLKNRGRVRKWKEVENHLTKGEGTLIIEETNKIGTRIWWTPDDLIGIAPMPVIRDFDGLGLSYITGKSSNPFVSWCFEHYLSLENGKAFLTRLEGLRLPPGPAENRFFLNLYPKAKIVQTLITRLRG